jgi:hypothetical protein
MPRPPSAHPWALALATALLACRSGADAPASAPAPTSAPLPAPAPELRPLQHIIPAYAGGRPIAWWSERLGKLRREGPQDLYRVTLDRARRNGLEVIEEDGGAVSVRALAAAGGHP